MMPLLTALSSCRDARRIASAACSLLPASAASRNRRTAVRSDDLADLLRRRAFSLVLMRLIWDLMLATRKASVGSTDWGRAATTCGRRDTQGYQETKPRSAA